MNRRKRVKPREKKSVRIFKRTLTVLLSFCLVVIVAFGVCYNLAIGANALAPYRETKPSLDIVTQGLEAVSLGNEVFLTNQQVNNTIAYLLKNAGKSEANPKVTGFYLRAGQEPGGVDFCAALAWNGRTWILSGAGTAAYENGGAGASYLVFTVDRIKLGNLPLPAGPVMRYMGGKLQQEGKVLFDGNRVKISAGLLPVQIKGFRAADNGFYVMADNLVDMIFGAVTGTEEETPLQKSVKQTLQSVKEQIDKAVSEEDKKKLASVEKELVESYLEMKDGLEGGEAAKTLQELQKTVGGLLDQVDVDVGDLKTELNDFLNGLLGSSQ